MKKLVAFLFILIFSLMGCSNKVSVIGKYEQMIPVNDLALAAVTEWLSAAYMSEEVEIEQFIDVTDVLLETTLYSDNSYIQSISENSYEASAKSANKGLEDALCELINIRFAAAGKETLSREEIDALMLQKTGITISDYIDKYGPKLMPTLEELQNKYNVSGSFALPEGDKLVSGLFNDLTLVAYAEEDSEYPVNLTVHVENGGDYTVRAMNYFYKNNLYLSLRDMASALSGTAKAYDVGVKDSSISIKTGMDYIATGGENEPFGEETEAADYRIKGKFKRNDLYINESERKYYSIIVPNSAGRNDCFLSITDFAMLFDIDMKIEGTDLYLYPSKSLEINPEKLYDEKFFDLVNSAIVGDVTTGEIFFEANGLEAVPMASTTKLMSYVIVMDAITKGTISENQILTVSYDVEKLANTSDGVIKVKEGDTVSVNEALAGMLLPSSNEMALLLAENVAGNEENFVKLMNEKAKSIGMSEDTRFYNCNGLPTFGNSVFNAKRQNMISAEDMFKLIQYTMAVYPEITNITSLKTYHMDSLQQYVNNTNPLLYNLEGVVGLKTGTTTKAGYCLVTLMNVDMQDGVHQIMTAEFGSENPYTRGMVSELLLRYGRTRLETNKPNVAETNGESNYDIDNPEKLIRLLLN